MAENKNSLNKYARLTGIAFEMMAIIFIFVWLGKKADEKMGNEINYFTALGSLIGLAGSLYVVIKQLKNVK